MYESTCRAVLVSLCLAVTVSGCIIQNTSGLGPLKSVIQKSLDSRSILFENENWRVVLKENQELPGSSKIRLNRVCGNLACLTDEEWVELRHILVMLGAVTREAFGSTHFTEACLMNNAYQFKPFTPLVHCHFYPRYETQVVNDGKAFVDTDGKAFVDEGFGHKYVDEDQRIVKIGPREKIIAIMRAGIARYLNESAPS